MKWDSEQQQKHIQEAFSASDIAIFYQVKCIAFKYLTASFVRACVSMSKCDCPNGPYQKQLRIWTLFTQCNNLQSSFLTIICFFYGV